MDADDVGVGKAMAAGGLTAQVIERDRIGADFGRQELEGDLLAQALILRQPDFAHAAAAQGADQREATRSDFPTRLQWT